MKYLKIFFLCSVLLSSITNCASQKTEKVASFCTKEVYKQSWTSGVKGGGSGINIFVNLQETLPVNITLDSIYFETYQLPLKQDNHNPLLFVGRNVNQSKKDFSILKTNAITDNPVTENTEKHSKFQLKENECIIRYIDSGDIKYFKYDALYRKQAPIIPNTRPKH
ncbi:hypothetical protein [uncultured Formosa sp.]|uniref:hypothetical protein n=1 Tax=uncultured Formosa sp. TaxID=255435 RepID=UPI00260246FC|nr:hypothetical protein [uncultured Formosa sp.]